MQIQPYLFFDGRCEEAIEYYRRTLGAEVTMLMRFKEAPPPPPGTSQCMVTPGSENKVMHAAIRIGETTVLLSDGRCGGQPNFQGFSLSLQPKDEAEAKRLFAALADGGQVQMPMDKTFFASCFGMVADRFGVSWMVYVALCGNHADRAADRRRSAAAAAMITQTRSCYDRQGSPADAF